MIGKFPAFALSFATPAIVCMDWAEINGPLYRTSK